MQSFKKAGLISALFTIMVCSAQAQVEHVQVVHPVYEFLQRGQARGFLKNYSLAVLPLQRSEIIECLQLIRTHSGELTENESQTLTRFEREFQIIERPQTVLFTTQQDTVPLFFDGLFTDAEKMLYYYRDSSKVVQVSLMGSLQQIFKTSPDSSNRAFVALGAIRAFGTLNGMLGFYMQFTNGAVLGDRFLGAEDRVLKHSLKFTELNSDVDLVESHVRFQKDWFYAMIGRETRLAGAGYTYRVIISDNAPPYDAISAGVRFKNFEYRFTHGSLLGIPVDSAFKTGVSAFIPDKYLTMHRAAFRQDWGEIGLWESVIYSDRGVDLAYLNPLSFLKSVEHSLRDRDNSSLGVDATVRPFKNVELRSSFYLDDLRFSEIGKEYWANKAAFNIGTMVTLPNVDVIAEYAIVHPYTFSHFDRKNSSTTDATIFTGDLLPNSDRMVLKTNWWWGNRYPVSLSASYTRHGANVYNEQDSLVKNVGGDVLQTIRWTLDSERAPFLDGDRQDVFAVEAAAGWEIIRGFALQGAYRLAALKESEPSHTFRLTFRFEDF